MVFMDNRNLKLQHKLSQDRQVVKIGDDSTGLLLKDNRVFIEQQPSQENEVANKAYVDSFFYQVFNCGYYATATGNFIPLNGYIIERTSTTSNNEFIAIVAPYNGVIEKVMWRSEAGQDGDTIFAIHESSDGTEVPNSTATTSITETIDIDDDTTHTFDINNLSSNVLSKGNIYAFKLTHPASPYDVNATIVIKWSIK